MLLNLSSVVQHRFGGFIKTIRKVSLRFSITKVLGVDLVNATALVYNEPWPNSSVPKLLKSDVF